MSGAKARDQATARGVCGRGTGPVAVETWDGTRGGGGGLSGGRWSWWPLVHGGVNLCGRTGQLARPQTSPAQPSPRERVLAPLCFCGVCFTEGPAPRLPRVSRRPGGGAPVSARLPVAVGAGVLCGACTPGRARTAFRGSVTAVPVPAFGRLAVETCHGSGSPLRPPQTLMRPGRPQGRRKLYIRSENTISGLEFVDQKALLSY